MPQIRKLSEDEAEKERTPVSGKVATNARQLRYRLQAKLGRSVTIQEVAEAIKYDRKSLGRFENNGLQLIDTEIIRRLGEYYESHGIDTHGLLQYNPEIGEKKAPRRGG